MAEDEERDLILVVSDDPRVGKEARYGFPPQYEVVVAADSRAAADAMSDRVPKAVVVDLQTGSAGGFNLAREMESSSRLSEVPILMLLERRQDSWLAEQAGASSYRVKPLPAASLVDDTLELIPN